ncbi:hypothetical protein P4597_27725, partial [Peribacillus simplex]|nr:hypothetical protein [Peribacillus simplex]
DDFGRVDSITVANDDKIERYAKYDDDYPLICLDLKEYTGKKDRNKNDLYYGDVVNLYVAGRVFKENQTIDNLEDLFELYLYAVESGISFEIIQ